MARVNIPITAIAELGTSQPSATGGDAANDHWLENSDCIVECKNTSGAPLDVTFVTSYVTAGGVTLSDNAVTVAAGAIKLVNLQGVARRNFYKQTADLDRIYVDVTSNSWEFRAYGV